MATINVNNMNFNSTLTTWMPPSCKQARCHVTDTAGIEVLLLARKMRALPWEQTV